MARGANFVFSVDFLKDRYGEETWNQVLDSLPPAAAEVWTSPLLVTGTYPFQAFKDMLDTLERVVEVVPTEETARMYEHIADRSLTTIHKFFFRFADPAFVIKRYPILWQRFFLAGKVEVPVAEKGHAELVFELPEIFLDWLAPACRGYSKRAIELAGGSGLEIFERETQALGGGSHRITYELRWSG